MFSDLDSPKEPAKNTDAFARKMSDPAGIRFAVSEAEAVKEVGVNFYRVSERRCGVALVGGDGTINQTEFDLASTIGRGHNAGSLKVHYERVGRGEDLYTV